VVEKDTARQHKVQLGPVIGKNIVVLNGLKEGEQFVVDGIQKLRDGAPVQNAALQPAEPAKDPSKK
jgi:membrane fusion protein (multidrug efflux system)